MIASFQPQFVPHVRQSCLYESTTYKPNDYTRHWVLTGNFPKIHTIRADRANRWHAGRSIQFWQGSPRNKGTFEFGTGVCVSTQQIAIKWFSKQSLTEMTRHQQSVLFQDCHYDSEQQLWAYVEVDGRRLNMKALQELAKFDGFTDLKSFFSWFSQPFEGKIIHWTDKRY